MDFFGVRDRGVPNSSQETFFETFRVFGVLGSVDGGGDLNPKRQRRVRVVLHMVQFGTVAICDSNRELQIASDMKTSAHRLCCSLERGANHEPRDRMTPLGVIWQRVLPGTKPIHAGKKSLEINFRANTCGACIRLRATTG